MSFFVTDSTDFSIFKTGIRAWFKNQPASPDSKDGGGPFEHDTWYHLALAVDVNPENPSMTVYVNGEWSFLYRMRNYKRLDANKISMGTYSSGSIDDFRLYNRLLSAK